MLGKRQNRIIYQMKVEKIHNFYTSYRVTQV